MKAKNGIVVDFFLQDILISFTDSNPSSLFSCICGLNLFQGFLVGDCICWGWGWCVCVDGCGYNRYTWACACNNRGF